MTFEDMTLLKKGWDSYNADPPNEWAIHQAQIWIATTEYKGDLRVNPSVVGGVGITYKIDGIMVYTEFLNKGKIIQGISFKDGDRVEVITRELTERLGSAQSGKERVA